MLSEQFSTISVFYIGRNGEARDIVKALHGSDCETCFSVSQDHFRAETAMTDASVCNLQSKLINFSVLAVKQNILSCLINQFGTGVMGPGSELFLPK